MRLLPRRTICALCEDWREGAQFVGQDQLYCFTTSGYHPKLPAGKRIHSQAQWNRVLKAADLTDDLGLAERVRRRRSGVRERKIQERRAAFRERLGTILKRALSETTRIALSRR